MVTGQTGMEDFCFLANAQKEMVGSVVSTFARWAALLGSAKRAQLYIHDTIGLRKMIDHLVLFTVLGMHWTNPKLKGRILFPIFQSEYMEREGLQKLKQEQQKNS